LIINPPRIVLISATPDIAEYGPTWTTKYEEIKANKPLKYLNIYVY